MARQVAPASSAPNVGPDDGRCISIALHKIDSMSSVAVSGDVPD